jgi:hypothetical protein
MHIVYIIGEHLLCDLTDFYENIPLEYHETISV